MYSNYSQIPANTNYYPTYNYGSFSNQGVRPHSNQGDRIFGGFLGPFVLGGITGGLLAPAFYPRPYYGPVYPPYYYRPY